MEDLSDRNLSDLMDALEDHGMEAVGKGRWAEVEAAEKQRDSLLKALRGEVERLRKVARGMNAEPHWAGRTSPIADAVDAWADQLNQIIDQHEQGVDRG